MVLLAYDLCIIVFFLPMDKPNQSLLSSRLQIQVKDYMYIYIKQRIMIMRLLRHQHQYYIH